jgi:hypothetical protein
MAIQFANGACRDLMSALGQKRTWRFLALDFLLIRIPLMSSPLTIE